jgi:hypothetical protein
MHMSTAQPEMEALKTRLKAMWMSGNFAEVAKHIETGAEEFARQVDAEWAALDDTGAPVAAARSLSEV